MEYLPYGDLLGYLRKSRGHEDTYNTGEKRPNSKLQEKDLLSFAWMIADGMSYLAAMKVSNGNRTEWSPIRSVIIRVITKSDDRAAGVRFVYHEYDYRPN